jgi:hypothetical protein
MPSMPSNMPQGRDDHRLFPGQSRLLAPAVVWTCQFQPCFVRVRCFGGSMQRCVKLSRHYSFWLLQIFCINHHISPSNVFLACANMLYYTGLHSISTATSQRQNAMEAMEHYPAISCFPDVTSYNLSNTSLLRSLENQIFMERRIDTCVNGLHRKSDDPQWTDLTGGGRIF